MKYLFRFIVCEASEIIDLPVICASFGILVSYTEIIIRSGRPRHRVSARGSIGVAKGGQGRAFAQPSLIFAQPSKFCQSKQLFILPHSSLNIIIVSAWQLHPVLLVFETFPFDGVSHVIR